MLEDYKTPSGIEIKGMVPQGSKIKQRTDFSENTHFFLFASSPKTQPRRQKRICVTSVYALISAVTLMHSQCLPQSGFHFVRLPWSQTSVNLD